MANTKKEPSVETAEKKTKVETDTNVNQENEVLKQKLQAMEAQMATLMQMVSGNINNTKDTSTERDISVISLTTGSLYLTTTGLDSGRRYLFSNQFDEVQIPEGDLKEIIKAMPETTQKGYFYINDEKFVKDAKLTNTYRNILSDKALNDIFSKDCKAFMNIYNGASKGQQKIIVDMVANKKLSGEFVDANIVLELGKACDRDLMSIEPMVAE